MNASSQKNLWRKALVYIALYIITACIVASVFFLGPSEGDSIPWLRTIIIIFATILLTKYFVYMIVSPWYDVWAFWIYKRTYRHQVKAYRPKVSVMIPAWNEAVGILSTVKSLLASTYTNTELIVVNDGSTDTSDQLIRGFLETYNAQKEAALKRGESVIDILYHYQQNGGKGSALNRAIDLSSGEILISIDADCAVDRRAIEHFVKYFAHPKVMAAVGNVKIGNTDTVIGIVQYLEFLFSFYFKKADSLFGAIYIIGGAAGAFRREVFEKVGRYSVGNITEDIELTMRIQDAGMKIVYASDAIVYTEGATDIADLKKQRLRWKRGRFQTFQAFRHLFFSVRQKHQKALTCITLPLALLGDIQLFLEPLFLVFLYVYSYLVNDYSSFISGIIVVSFMFIVQIFFDDRKSRTASFYVLAPIGWLLFYLSTFVEYIALLKSLWVYLRKQEVTWQRWNRKGVLTTE